MMFLKNVMVILFAATLAACSQYDESSNIMIELGPDEPADIVYLFKEKTKWDEILEFERTVVGTSNETGSGYKSHPSTMSAVAVRVRGHESQAVQFAPRATDAERADFKRRLTESRLIYAVYEHVIPSRITASTVPSYQSK